jgi:enoyl-CoA hydratase/carnithine racemase
MSYQNITTGREERLFILTINRPDVMNALNPETHAEMARAFDEFEQDPELWVAIITGAGDAAFCAGGDISAMVDAKCRWSTRHCLAAGVNSFAPNCRDQADTLTAKLQEEQGAKGDVCCKKTEEEPFYSPVIQERAWTSHIWYDAP